MTTTHGGSATVWRWEVRGRQGEVLSVGDLPMWGLPEQQDEMAARWVAEKFAIMLLDVEPHYERLAGCRVRLWCGDREAVSCSEEWMETLRGGPLARMRDRVDLLPRRGRRRLRNG